MAGPKAAGTADGSTQHTPNQADSSAEPNPLAALSNEQVLQLLDVWQAQQAEEQRALQANSRVAAYAEGHTRPLLPAQLTALEKLRAPFAADQISKRPQPWCKACNNSPTRVCKDHTKIKCTKCDTWITEAHNDLDYVGHAGITARLLEVDPTWDWEPLSVDNHGHPFFDQHGGLWIKLTVCGMTRKGYGDAVGKKAGPTAVKEAIGDAIRNAAMRFGTGLDLWSKTDLHKESEPEPHPAEPYLNAIRQERVWTSAEYLAGVRQEADEAGHLDYALPNGGGKTLGDVIDAQLTVLADAAQKLAEMQIKREEEREEREAARAAAAARAAEERQAREDARAAAAAQVAREHGVTPQNGKGLPPITEAQVRNVCVSSWIDPDALDRALAAGEACGVVDVPSRPEEPDGPTLGQAMRRQITELRQTGRSGTARASNAANQNSQHDWGSLSERAG